MERSTVCIQNYVRVVEVWWDEYKDYFYASRPETLTLAYGDISELKRFRYIFPAPTKKKTQLHLSHSITLFISFYSHCLFLLSHCRNIVQFFLLLSEMSLENN